MFAVYADHPEPNDPLSALVVGERPDPVVPSGWVKVKVAAASVNHHDVWTLKGVGIPADRFPMILGCDAAGLDAEGQHVLVHSVIGTGEDETLDPHRTLLSEYHQGTFADYVVVPERNVVPIPSQLTLAEAACLPTAWLTAYRMLTTRGGLTSGETVLVQGVGGGVATAAVVLAKAMGARVWITSRDEHKQQRARGLGADETFASGERLPERVDLVIESVGQATWDHSIKSLRSGGRLITTGATSGDASPALLRHIFFRQLSVIGSTMGTRAELLDLMDFCVSTGIRPLIDRIEPMTQARDAIAAVAAGDIFGKVVLTRQV
jgi:NADPH:quinone reductase-like Zn-dependent oxidoreductase